MEALSDIYKKCWLYLVSLKHFPDLPLHFDLNLDPYGNPVKLKSFHICKY